MKMMMMKVSGKLPTVLPIDLTDLKMAMLHKNIGIDKFVPKKSISQLNG